MEPNLAARSRRERGTHASCLLLDLNETLISRETAVRPSVAVAGREKGGEPETSAELTAIDRRENYARDSFLIRFRRLLPREIIARA